MTMEPLTRAELREELDRSLRHYATKADLANLKFALAAWMLLLVSAATGILHRRRSARRTSYRAADP